jgi:hypothetical protein
MPFSPLRTWGLGLVTWVMLGAGVYCLWEWADGTHPPRVERQEVRDRSGRVVGEREQVITDADSRICLTRRDWLLSLLTLTKPSVSQCSTGFCQRSVTRKHADAIGN